MPFGPLTDEASVVQKKVSKIFWSAKKNVKSLVRGIFEAQKNLSPPKNFASHIYETFRPSDFQTFGHLRSHTNPPPHSGPRSGPPFF
jgi:hypothetical protein